MKKILLVCSLLLVLINSSFSQIICDQYKNMPSFRLNPFNKEKICIDSTQPYFNTKSYNNDSLFMAYNDYETYNPTVIEAGFIVDSAKYVFKNIANKFDLGHGTLWILKATSPTAKMLSLKFEKFEFPDGAIFSFYSTKKEGNFLREPKFYDNRNLEFFTYAASINQRELIVEYYEPKNCIPAKLIIDKFYYFFTDGMDTPYKKKAETNVDNNNIDKSLGLDTINIEKGPYGTAVNNCSNMFPCGSASDWLEEAKCVGYIQTRSGSEIHRSTCFFINMSDDYDSNQYPYIVTAGHHFQDKNQINFKDNIVERIIQVNYQMETCNGAISYGDLAGEYTIKKLGASYNTSTDSADYVHGEDYALLKYSKKLSELEPFDVCYMGWDNMSFNYNSSNGYSYIGHPNGDYKALNQWDDRGFQGTGITDFFRIKNSLGINEEGFSGSPVFYDASKKIVGWVATKDVGSFSCSDGLQYSNCGAFCYLYDQISDFIDPTGIGSASYYKPIFSHLPDHCSNCIQDEDETGIDCGGSCLSCGVNDNLSITSNTQFESVSVLNARNNIVLDGQSEQIQFYSTNFEIAAGNSIKLRNTKISNGATIKIKHDPTLTYTEAKGCQPPCADLPYQFYLSESLNKLVFWGQFAFVDSYDIIVFNSYGQKIYEEYSQPVFWNGATIVWDGTGITSSADAVYYPLLTLYGCMGSIEYVNIN